MAEKLPETVEYESPTHHRRLNRRISGAVFAAAIPVFAWVATLVVGPLDVGPDTPLLPYAIAFGVVLVGAGLAGLVLGMKGLKDCKANPQRERGRVLGWCAVFVSLAWMLVAYPWCCHDLYGWRHHVRVMTAGARESRIVAECERYARDNGGKYPESLAELVASGRLHGDEIVWPYSGTSPYLLAAGTTVGDWHTIQSEVATHCDFLYFGRGLDTSVVDVQKIVTLALKPELGAPEFSISSATGYGLAWNYNELQKANDASNQERAKAGLLPVALSSLVR